MAQPSSSLATAADRMLHDKFGVGLEQWLRHKRQQGVSFRRIATELTDATGGVVVVSHQTLSNWCDDRKAAA